MRSLTRSTLAFARAALKAGQRALPPYSHPKSPHKYTQPQLFALLALKDFLRKDYRGLVRTVAEWSELRRALGLQGVPDHSTVAKAEKRLLKKTGMTG